MKLNDIGIKDKKEWEQKGYITPCFDREVIRKHTKSAPVWLHFGAGNIFRAFIVVLAQRLIDMGSLNGGIIAGEGYDYEILDIAYKPFDDLSICVTLMPDGNVKKEVVCAVTESVKTDKDGMSRLREIFASPNLQLVSFTITEKAYDMNNPFIGILAELCLCRFINGAFPLALVSMDNCSNNGILLKNAVLEYAKKNINTDADFLSYIDNPEKLSFPCTMIDKITPYPDRGVAKMLTDDGIEDMKILETAMKSVTAPFVNAEAPQYLVIEDVFPNGRPPLEKVGVMFTDRESVYKVEKMKVSTCLNPLHTAISVFACMLGFTRVSDAMRDEDLQRLVQMVAKEGLPVVSDPKIISPSEFIDTVLNLRLPNPHIPDTPQRIATDTSKKLAVRFGETIKAYMQSDKLDIRELVAIPLVLAGWCRYIMGIDDDGNEFETDPDPLLPELKPLFDGITLGCDDNYASVLRQILSKSDIFGVDLYKAGIAEKVTSYFGQMISEPGAIRKALQENLPHGKS